MTRTVLALVLVPSFSTASGAAAQGGNGSLRGAVKDEQGAALPGVTITATSPALLTPSVTIADDVGNYRLITGGILTPGVADMELIP